MFEFCSGLVDLVVGVRHHRGGGHRLTLAGERFVRRLAEDIAQMGDQGVDLRKRCSQGTECETGDGGPNAIAVMSRHAWSVQSSVGVHHDVCNRPALSTTNASS